MSSGERGRFRMINERIRIGRIRNEMNDWVQMNSDSQIGGLTYAPVSMWIVVAAVRTLRVFWIGGCVQIGSQR